MRLSELIIAVILLIKLSSVVVIIIKISSVVVIIINKYTVLFIPGDIGGAMGLFIGASMLTILEIIDLFLIQLPIFKHRKEIKKSSSS